MNDVVAQFQISDGLYGTVKFKNDGVYALWLWPDARPN
jgi:hypothetical protein